MKPLWVRTVCCALIGLVCSVDTASAAWNNVFQVTCFLRPRQSSSFFRRPVVVQSSPVIAYSSPTACCDPCPQPCPQTSCKTTYVQRSYYQPVTTYQTKTYYEPVTTYRTSYYYEPVTSYRYSCYYDPCTCSYKQVAVPTTSYCLKSKCCPVQSWVQRCTQVPVQSYKQCYYWEPQTTCCTTTSGSPIFSTSPPAENPPGVTEQRTPATPNQQQQPQNYNQYYGPPQGSEGSQTKSNGFGGYQPSLGNPMPQAKPLSQPPSQRPLITPEKFVSLTTSTNRVNGQVVSHNNAPRAFAKVVFVSADDNANRESVAANASGEFLASLSAGQWYVYLQQTNGQEVYHSKIRINESQPSFLTLVSR